MLMFILSFLFLTTVATFAGSPDSFISLLEPLNIASERWEPVGDTGEVHHGLVLSKRIITDGGSDKGGMPRPFDTSVGTNFSSNACSSFFHTMIKDERLLKCAPISLMLQSSSSYFDVTKSLVTITSVLDQACDVDVDRCTALTSAYATALVESNACGTDFAGHNPLIMEAYAGLVSYPTVYSATCLKTHGAKSQYCYAEAITNATNPTAGYVYYLPLGLALPGGAMPICNNCLKRTMAMYAAVASNGSLPISAVYNRAANSIDMFCGPQFARDHIHITGGAPRVMGAGVATAFVAACAATFLLL